MIIVFEGIDNAGKTTIAERLVEYLDSIGKKVILSKELTTDIGELIKKHIEKDGLSPILKSYLFAADRQMRIENMNNEFKEENIIIFDRYVHSAIVYRELEGLNGKWIKEINKQLPKSNLSFYIDITPEESIRRNNEKKFNIKYSLKQLDTVRESYNHYVDEGELIFIDGMRNFNDVLNEILDIIKGEIDG